MTPHYWTVPPIYKGETIFILGCGPSLRGFDPASIRGQGPVIVINDSFQLVPYADVLYFCDLKWWNTRREKVQKTFHGSLIVTLENQIATVHALHQTGKTGLEVDPTGLRTGANSGYQAINLAVHFGAKRIVLLGYDMKVRGNWMHWNIRPERMNPSRQQMILNSFNTYFPHLKEPLETLGIEVINATPDSALTVWPHVPLEHLLHETVDCHS